MPMTCWNSMADIHEHQHDARVARNALNAAEETLYSRRNGLRSKQGELARARRLGQAGLLVAQQLENDIRGLEEQIEGDLRALSDAKANLSQILERFPAVDS